MLVCALPSHNLCGSRDSLFIERRTRDRKVVSSNPGRNGGKSFLLQISLSVLTLILCPFHPVLPQWHVKDPGHSGKSSGGSLHLTPHIPLTQRSRSGLTMPLSRHSVGTYPERRSHATCQGTFGHGRLSSLRHYGLILA